jgi:hypothetical protein
MALDYIDRLFMPRSVGPVDVAKEANITQNAVKENTRNETRVAKAEEAIAAREFGLFAQLPQEIQDLVWKSAIDSIGPRVVEIKKRYYNGFTSSCPIPNVLHACRASRQLALKRWKPSLAMKDGPARILFDSSMDILFFGRYYTYIVGFVYCVRPADRLELRHMAFDPLQQYYNDYFDDGEDLAINIHRHFPAIRSVMLVYHNQDYSREKRWLLDPRRTVIEFYMAGSHQECVRMCEGTVRQFKDTCALRGWPCPQFEHKHYCRSYPNPSEALDREGIPGLQPLIA